LNDDLRAPELKYSELSVKPAIGIFRKPHRRVAKFHVSYNISLNKQ
jgi:hypothetical protein